jgi:hypothetical protein
MKTIYSLEFQKLGVVDQYFVLAHAYLDGSKTLCTPMLNANDTSGFSNTRVVLHLSRQAIELFLKGAIYSTTGNHYVPKMKDGGPHNLVTLIAEYKRTIPDPQYHFELPFGLDTVGDLCAYEIDWAKLYHLTLDQRHRYPTDKNGKLFTDDFAVDSFTPLSYFVTLEELSKVFFSVESYLQRRVVG